MTSKALFAAAALASSLAPVSSAMAAEGAAVALEQYTLANDAYLRYRAQAEECRWGRPTVEVAMRAERNLWSDLASFENKPAVDAISQDDVEPAACGGPADGQSRGESAMIYWRWLTRAAVYAQFNRQPGWTLGLFNLEPTSLGVMEPVRKAIEQDISGQLGQERITAEINALGEEARLVANLICEGRKDVRSSTPRACPEVPANFAPQLPLADVRATRVESFTFGLPSEIRHEQLGEYGRAYQFRFDAMDFSSDCKALASTIYPAAPDTTVLPGGILEVTVRRYGEAAAVERDKVKKDGLGYVMVDDAGNPIKRSRDSFQMASYDFCF